MIDNIFLSKKDNSITNLRNSYEKMNYKTGEVYQESYYKNFRIRKYTEEITILGSVTKFALGNNYENTSYKNCIEVLNSLESETGFNLNDFVVRKLEIGSCFSMEQAPHFYIDNMIELPRYKSGVYYSNKKPTGKVFEIFKNQFIAYDKSKEVGAKNLKQNYIGQNLLRIEDKYLRQIKKSFGFVPTGNDLKDNYIKNMLLNRYLEKFNNITKEANLEIPDNCKTLGKLKKGLLLVNTKESEQLINSTILKMSKGEISPTEASKMRKFFRERELLAKEFNLADELNEELKSKIIERIDFELNDKI